MLRFGMISATRYDIVDYNRLEFLGLGSIQAYLNEKLIDVEVALFEDIDELISFKPDIVGIGSITENYGIAISWATKLKELLNVPIIIGGVHISLLPESMTECFDIAVIGEGEVTIAELLSSIIDNNGIDFNQLIKIPGLYFFQTGIPRFTGNRELIEDLDTIPHLKRSNLPFWRKREDAHIFTSRGCPYHCNFCSSTKFFPTYRTHSVEYIIEEIKSLVFENGIKNITIMDDLLVADRKKFTAVVQMVESSRINEVCSFNILLRSNIVDKELCRLLLRLNTFSAVIGIESFSDKILKYYNKSGVTAEVNQAAIDLLNSYNISVSGCFIFGAPVETRADLIKTLEAIYFNLEQDKINSVYWSVLKPYPGTEMWGLAKSRGLVGTDMDWEKYVQRNYDWKMFFNNDNDELVMHELMDRQEFKSILSEWFDKFSTIKPNWGYGYTQEL